MAREPAVQAELRRLIEQAAGRGRDMSLNELADASGLDVAAISRFVAKHRGRGGKVRGMSLESAVALATALEHEVVLKAKERTSGGKK